MAQSAPVQPMPELNPDAKVGASVAMRWTTWLMDFERFVLVSGITDTKRQRALLLYTAGNFLTNSQQRRRKQFQNGKRETHRIFPAPN